MANVIRELLYICCYLSMCFYSIIKGHTHIYIYIYRERERKLKKSIDYICRYKDLALQVGGISYETVKYYGHEFCGT
jgi:hypothetical protein